MKKRCLTLFLAAALALTMAGCSKKSKEEGASAATTGAENDNGKEEKPEQEEEAGPALTFEETVLYNDDNCSITALGMNPGGSWGFTLTIRLENKTDAGIMFAVDGASVNGVMSDPFWACSVEGGSTLDDEIAWDTGILSEYGIDTVTALEVAFRAYEADNYSNTYMEETFDLYPYGEEAAVSVQRETRDSDLVLVDNEYCTIIATGITPHDLLGYSLNLYVVNKCDSAVMFSADNASLDGIACECSWAAVVNAGRTCYSEATWYEEDLGELDPDSITTIDLTLTAYDYDDWSISDYVSEPISIHAEAFQ